MLSKAMELMKVADLKSDAGINLHIHIRERIPDMEEFPNLDQSLWDSFKEDLQKRYDWEPKHRFIWKECDLEDKHIETFCLHLNSGITVYKPSNVKKAQVLFDAESDANVINELRENLNSIQEKQSEHTVGIIQQSGGRGLYVRFLSYRPYDESIIDYMGSEIQEFGRRMKRQLRENGRSGLYLLHGQPGTGKTSFLKEILPKVDKKSLFITPSMTEHLASPTLISLLIDHPDSILIIEDAETVLMKRGPDNSNSVANLLNLTDGFPADFLNLNIICTFNTDLEDIDPALLREGRLRGIQEFTTLPPENARKLAKAMGNEMDIHSPMTVAEVCNAGIKNTYNSKQIGFDMSREVGSSS